MTPNFRPSKRNLVLYSLMNSPLHCLQKATSNIIEVKPGSTRPHRGMFQLAPAELLATKEYITDLIRKQKIHPSESPYGAPLSFVKQKGKLRGVIDYRALNWTTKHNNTPIPRTNEMFDRLGQAQFFSKLDLKTGFPQITISPDDVENRVQDKGQTFWTLSKAYRALERTFNLPSSNELHI